MRKRSPITGPKHMQQPSLLLEDVYKCYGTDFARTDALKAPERSPIQN
ncbi:MAG: hypothetical protein IKM59_05085 [Oscillospiraceae bacterium]|nr:hypothetical protein [Oscillospiraceae bacterium]